MKELLSAWFAVGNVEIGIELWQIWIFTLLISLLVVARWKRAIAVVSLLAALMVSGRDSIHAFLASSGTIPHLGLFYGILGICIVSGFLFSLILDD
ncbi:MAG: hypothetical protein AB1568_02470 [Thermodesulfobacteriota bacterium]